MQRMKHDFYPTPSFYTEKLLEKVTIEGTVFEPCNGEGAISRHFLECTTNDIDESKEADFNLDASVPLNWMIFGDHDWVVTNPPFNQADRILPLAFNHARLGCAFFLRLTFMEPTANRRDWMQNHRLHLAKFIPVNPRPRFREDTRNTDSVTCAWFVFRKSPVWDAEECPFDFI